MVSRVVLSGVWVAPLVLVGAHPAVASPGPRDDAYQVCGASLTVSRGRGLLANDGREQTLVAHTDPAHGTLSVTPDGAFTYTPEAGFSGTDQFTYTATDAVQLYSSRLPALATIGGVTVTGGGYGSAVAPVPGSSSEFYGLTDRGPNVDGPDGVKVEPLPAFVPSIGRFRFVDGAAKLVRTIPLRNPAGHPYSGQVNSQTSTGETIVDLAGAVLPPDPDGFDPEGLVALRDGTFWVSDEYGPFLTHFDARGRELQRLSPFGGGLPAELANRVPNKGMEGLTVTPDGSTLVGIMQSALQQPDVTAKPKNVTTLRIVTYRLRDGATHEYLYLLDNPKDNSGAVSEITALSDTTFLVDERDGNYAPTSYKKLWKIDLAAATDVGPQSTLAGAVYAPADGGLLIGGRTVEALVGAQDTAKAQATLAAAGITAGAKSPFLDVVGLVNSLDPTARFFSHDKIEGLAALRGGRTIVISNDSDFGIDGLTNSTVPYALHAKTSAGGAQDDGEFLVVDLDRLPAATTTVTVSLAVRPHR